MWEAKGFEVSPGHYDKSHEGGRSREHRGETQEPLGQLGSQEVGWGEWFCSGVREADRELARMGESGFQAE